MRLLPLLLALLTVACALQQSSLPLNYNCFGVPMNSSKPVSLCGGSDNGPCIMRKGFKDFWPLPVKEGSCGSGPIFSCEVDWDSREVEPQSSVAGRVSKFLETYEGLICLTGVDYVMYAKDALKGRDQNRQIAPLVVERFQGANVNERDNRRTGTTGRRSQSSVEEHQKVWRFSFTTYNNTLWNSDNLLFPKGIETVVSSGDRARATGLAVFGVVVCALLMI